MSSVTINRMDTTMTNKLLSCKQPAPAAFRGGHTQGDTTMTMVTISRDGTWAGNGIWTDDCEIVDCPAVLGDDQDASDETYEAICDALASLPQDDEHWRGPVTVERPDGTYTAELLDG